jgi:SAM-dependent methyltransferase
MGDFPLVSPRFPRASRYHPEWVLGNVSGAANALCLIEWLSEAMELRPRMRVLDLGCGRALTSIFLHREFDMQVWAADLWNDPTDNARRARDADAADGVFPLRADARSLPFAEGFFDAIVCVDSFMYFGTDDMYLPYLARFVKPGGTIGVAQAAMLREVEDEVPAHLRAFWAMDNPFSLHSSAWWRRHWEKTGIVDVLLADDMPDGWRLWLEWLRLIAPQNTVEIAALEADRGEHFGYVRFVGRRREEALLGPNITSIQLPAGEYVRHPLLRP